MNGGVSMFIGREAELKFLNDKYEENGGQLIVLYGRRRVGKPKPCGSFARENRMYSFPVRRQQTRYSFVTFRLE